MTLSVGLTGNVAAGKSTVAGLFAAWGARIVDADRIVRALQEPGTPVHAAIIARFGPAVLHADGSLNRAALRAAVLADDAARRDLEAIVHPAVRAERDRMLAAARHDGAPVVVQEIPLLFETTDPSGFDAVVLVDAPVAVRRARLMGERRLSAEEADRLIAAQMPAEEKRARSTWVIDNTGSREALVQAASRVWEALLDAARAA